MTTVTRDTVTLTLTRAELMQLKSALLTEINIYRRLALEAVGEQPDAVGDYREAAADDAALLARLDELAPRHPSRGTVADAADARDEEPRS
jgi:hypothetical protein